MTSKLLYFFCGLLICASVTIAADIPEYPFVFVVGRADLALSQQAVGNVAEARKEFAKLKDVPNISPRILRLWELYAETRLGDFHPRPAQ
jgi:hypothetical protein